MFHSHTFDLPRLAVALAAAALFSAPAFAQTKVTIAGAGSMVPVMQELAKSYESKAGPQGLELSTTSLGSGGGIKAVDAGKVTIGLTGRPLKDAEKGTVVYRQLAVNPVVMVVSASLPVTTLSAAQICGIYSGAITSWKQVGGPDAPIVPLTRNEDDSDKEALREDLACYKGLKESADVVMLSSGGAMRSAVAARPMAIGLTTFETVLKSEGKLKAIAIDGVAPDVASVAGGKYRLVKDFAVVTKGEPQGAAKAFIEFAASPEGQKIMAQSGLVPRK
ncbi:MAG TPA: phosphate ABC transporter substrate-binding protein [Ramlibacter sp.]|jgi:phosphate transport system substrate-binding protein